MEVGKCPHCEKMLNEEDIEEVQFRGVVTRHFAYVCRFCRTIIGFGAARHYGV